MAAHQETTVFLDFKEEEMQPNSTEPAEQFEEPNPTEFAENEKQQHPEDFASSPGSVSKEAKSDKNEDVEQAIENLKSAKKNIGSSTEEDSTLEENTSCQHDGECHGDYVRQSPQNEEQAVRAESVSAQEHNRDEKARETTTSPMLGDKKDDQVDGPVPQLDNESSATDTEENLESALPPVEENDTQENTTSLQTPPPDDMPAEEVSDIQRCEVETIGPIIQPTTKPTDSGVSGGGLFSTGLWSLMVVGLVVVCVAILVQQFLKPESPPPKKNIRQIDIFLKEMEKVKTQFPHQRSELWIRSKIHLQRHLQTPQPTEPVSLILTAGLRAERTLQCMAQGLASAFSSAFNASVLHIDGASKANQDSDQVKLDIDSKLQGAFEGDKPVAVIHRFEELPPGSTLIFYRYCDHENAAYKKTFLIFTVLLGEEEDIPAKTRLNAVEEMVDDHLQKKFLSHGHPVSFDRMDLDKYGGLWSRISHLILPVAAEERIEHEGC
ncbi:torsin-1A-interacting protein 2-like [Parambassis ranga]|uniref:Torsin-1A-interacting protein 2-like n=1 Tax=Parambassis ranga TaxID=210632 RepID=A0A6P7I3F6_9TELE|nr:torsin-1A-interacting protein 2-like [Parambassis ranga]